MRTAAQDLARAAELLAAPPVRLIRGDAVALEPVRWLWPGFLPAGMLTILGGSPGCGKTTIALSLAAIITRGGAWPDGTRCAQPGDVLVWSGEDGHSVIAARLQAEGADMRRVHFIDGLTEGEGDPAQPFFVPKKMAAWQRSRSVSAAHRARGPQCIPVTEFSTTSHGC